MHPVTLILVHVHFLFTFCDLEKVAAEDTWHPKDRISLPGRGGGHPKNRISLPGGGGGEEWGSGSQQIAMLLVQVKV